MNCRESNIRFYGLLLTLSIWLMAYPIFGFSATYTVNPDNYRNFTNLLQAGDTLELSAGSYDRGLLLKDIHGTQDNPIMVIGPQIGLPAVLLGSLTQAWNTVQLDNVSYLVLRHLKIDGLGVPYVDAVNARGITHNITLENLTIVNHGGSYQPDTEHQQTIGIATRGPAWEWVIRNNTIIGAGTGMYLGNSDGSAAFVRGVIEYNVILDTLGYNMQIKHQNPRPLGIGLPVGDSKTIIRHNVYSKANKASMGVLARPNLLVGHFPVSGEGHNDVYEIYGNFFYQNPAEALFQGEGNIAFYNNIMVNDHGPAVNILPHNDVPRMIRVFNNTIVAHGTGISISGGDLDHEQKVIANAVFANTPINAKDQFQNVTDGFNAAVNYLNAPTSSLGIFDLYPKQGKLSGSHVDTSSYDSFTDWDLDFNGNQQTGTVRGAYAGDGENPGWLPKLENKPTIDTLSVGPMLSFSVLPLSILTGGRATLSWTATNASACTAAGAWMGSKDTSGKQMVGPLTETAKFDLSCVDEKGNSVTRSVTVAIEIHSLSAPSPPMRLTVQ